MATLQEKLIESLAVLKTYQDTHSDNLVIQGAETLGRTHTERLVASGYLQMVIKGWYIPSSPGSDGDSTVWYVSYWSFVTAYLNKKFGEAWCLSPELSLYFYSGKTVIPKLIVRSEMGTNNILQMPFGTSLLDIKAKLPTEMHQTAQLEVEYYPQWVDRMNLRFLYRMYKEPYTRKRYFMGGLKFPLLFLWDRFFGHK